MDDRDYTKTLIGIIDSLGGPRYAAEDLAWASSMPQGKRLLEWLSAQVPREDAGLNAPQLDEEVVYQAAVQPIALHEQELLELVRDLRYWRISTQDIPESIPWHAWTA